ncbi:hypothetical protein SEUCBS139899_001321 [Sporothrix eucalyptigena]
MARKAAPAETTPLLGEAHDDSNNGINNDGDSVSSSSESTAVPTPVASSGDDKPMPKVQVALLCFARLLEPIAFFSVFPYINEMVQDNGGLADTDVGFYSGVIESLFSLTQATVMLGWGRAADRVGRKPVLVLSLVGMSSATALFGLARTLEQMIAFRCLAGVFAGTIVTIRTMLAEQSTPATQARVFSWFAFSGNLGIFLGPLLGGALAAPLGRRGEPGSRPPGSEDSLPFLAKYPYALPAFVVAGLGFLAATMAALFIEETLVRKPTRPSSRTDGGDAGSPPPAPPSAWDLFKAPGVPIVLYVYAHVMLLAFSYTALVPVFWFTPVHLGGLGFTPGQIAAMMGISGAGQALWLLLVFPPLHYRIGTNGVMRLCAAAYPVFMAASPIASLLLRVWDARTLFWTVVPPVLVFGSGVSMCFTAIQLAVNDIAPSPQLLGTLNALALTGVSAIRAFTPALFTSLYAINARTQLLGGYAIWVLMVAIAFGYTIAARYLPDYEALKKARSEPNAHDADVPNDGSIEYEAGRVAVPRHRHGKKYLYLEPPIHGSKTVRTRVTTIIPPLRKAASPPPPPPPPVQLPPIIIQAPPPLPPPLPPVVVEAPPPPVEEEPTVVEESDDDTIDVIAVDVEPEPEKPKKPRKRSRSRRREVERETVYVERERLVPVHVPVPMPMTVKMRRRQPSPPSTPPPPPPPPPRQPEYETFRYIDAPRRSPPLPLPPSPPRTEEWETTHDRIVIREREGRRPQQYYRY